jgi:hypothetical protein
MGAVKQFCMDVSEALGLEGEITLDVKIMTERIIQNININFTDKAQYAIESMRIARDFRKLRAEIAEQSDWIETKAYLCSQGVG